MRAERSDAIVRAAQRLDVGWRQPLLHVLQRRVT
jgi:hypothetical protein